METFDIFPCYFLKVLFYSCSQLRARQLHTLRTPRTTHQQRSQLASQLPTIGNRPTNSKKSQHRCHSKLSQTKYRILNRLTGEYPQLTEDYHPASLLASYLQLHKQIVIQAIGSYTVHLPPPSEALSAFQSLCNYIQLELPSYIKIIGHTKRYLGNS